MKSMLQLLLIALFVCMAQPACTNVGSLDGDTGDTSANRTLTGAITATQSGKHAPHQATEERYSVVVQSVETLEAYRGETDASGEFEVEIPESETGDVFMVTIMSPDGQPAGPVLFGQDGDEGLTGLAMDGAVDLGTIDFPDDPSAEPLVPGSAATFDEADVQDDVVARLDQAGVPVGIQNFGRGDDAAGTASTDPAQQADRDKDGLIDIFDADDDGDGTVDDFDDDAELNPGGDGLDINFFMNLKIDDVQATAYFTGNVPGIEASLKNDTVITFEVRAHSSFGKNITAARIIGPPSPAPPYLPLSTVNGGALWSASSYALQPDGTNHFQEWAVPHDFMNTGDTFTVEITFDDGTVGVYSRMINYVFKSIPKLEKHGTPAALVPFAGPAEIVFDGTQDLVLEWAPPVDDFGNLMVGLPYHFEVFYYDGVGQQINDIDATTWATPITYWNPQNQFHEVPGTVLTTLSASNTFTMQLPKELFPNTVQTAAGAVAVSSYKVDIAAQNNGNNAALMIRLRK